MARLFYEFLDNAITALTLRSQNVHSKSLVHTPASAAPRAKDGSQRSFNWQSIAFVMRRLWVQIPPLAFSFDRIGTGSNAFMAYPDLAYPDLMQAPRGRETRLDE